MRPDQPKKEQRLPAILVTVVCLIALTSPLMQWWSSMDSPWYTLYLLWGGVILFIALINSP
ncbi:MAG: hypothetical protein HN842_09505 [Gammaproteobacteria bacterium]|jgi:hypothetical protein|nr:hypothetical protein [Gammaproteobacteria bacterium]